MRGNYFRTDSETPVFLSNRSRLKKSQTDSVNPRKQFPNVRGLQTSCQAASLLTGHFELYDPFSVNFFLEKLD